MLFFIVSCSTFTEKSSQSEAVLLSEFKKICLAGSGKGRIEILSAKHTFSYESQINFKQNTFDMALEFPIIGERELVLSLNPEVVNRTIKTSQVAELLKEQLGERSDRIRISKSIEEFFVFASDFMRFRAKGVFPRHFMSHFDDGHFILERATPSYRFVVDNFSDNATFYERTVFKIFIKNLTNDPILTLFLVPQSCDI